MDSIEKLARKVARLEHRLNTQARTPQLAYSSLDNGTIPEYDADGQVVAWYGQQIDGTHGAVVLNGPVPPTPTPPVLTPAEGGGVSIAWDGFFAGQAPRPMDLDFVRAKVADNEDMDGAETVGCLVASGALVAQLPVGIYYVTLVAESKPGLLSTPTDAVEVEVTELMVRADMLEPVMELRTVIIAGDPAGQHARMDPTGFRAFAPPSADGEAPREAIRFGVDGSDDYLGVTNAMGDTVASLNSEGDVSGRRVYANEGLVYQGRELSEIMAEGSSSLVGYGARYDPPGNCDNDTGWGIMEISVSLRGDRTYRVATNNILMTTNVTTNPEAELQVRCTYSETGTPPAPTVSNGSFITASREHIGPGLSNSMKCEKLIITATGNYRFLLFFKKFLGDGIIAPEGSATFPIEFYVEDIGPARQNLMIPTAGGGIQFTGNTAAPPPAAPAAQPRELYADAQALQTYTSNGAPYTWGPAAGKMYQGTNSAGWLRSMAMFNDLTGYLSGSEITGMQAYFYFDHWFDNAGGTASIGVHGVAGTSAPGSYSGGTFATTSPGWPKPGGRWVDIPSHLWNGFKTGAYRGLLLEAPNNIQSYGSATVARLFIKYNK